jgi:hypothetical protein
MAWYEGTTLPCPQKMCVVLLRIVTCRCTRQARSRRVVSLPEQAYSGMYLRLLPPLAKS